MIKISHAHKYYNRGSNNELHVMNDIDLELPDKGLVAVFGKSGCGKTTLLNTVGGLDRLNSGEITVFGENISDGTDDIRNKYIGYIFQNYNLSKNETVSENVADALRLCGMEDADEINVRVIAALKNVGMDKFKNRLPDTLSGGQQQRVAIARAIVKNPAIILADEPTGNLDEANTILVMDILKQISRDHLVILVTHEASLVDHYCDRVIELVDGKVNSVYDNANANGYESRNKNDIYLGELPMTESAIPGAHIEYYGEPNGVIELRIVNSGGKLYLRSGTPGLKILDDSSEIKFREGCFEKKDASLPRSGGGIDMSALKPVDGKKFGRLFSFRSSVVSGYRENCTKKSKKGGKLLRVSMFLLACLAVFITAKCGVSIKELLELGENHNDKNFYIMVGEHTNDTSSLLSDPAASGIDYACLADHFLAGDMSYTFRVGNFVTAVMSNVKCEGTVADIAISGGMSLVCGTREPERPFDVVITTAVADDLLESSNTSFLSEYTDLINMVSVRTIGDGNRMRIVGIVSSDEKFLFMNRLSAAYTVIQQQSPWFSITPASMLGAGESAHPERGQLCAYIFDNERTVGEKILLNGNTYTISETVRIYMDLAQYDDFVKDKYGETLLGMNEYIDLKIAENPDADRTSLSFEWLLDYYTVHYREFVRNISYVGIDAWLYGRTGQVQFMIETLTQSGRNPEYSAEELYYAYQQKQATGAYPTEEELRAFVSGEEFSQFANSFFKELYGTQDEYWDEYSVSQKNEKRGFVMNDEDFVTMSYTIGDSDSDIAYRNNGWILVHATDVQLAGEYLNKNWAGYVDTPDEVYETKLSDIRRFIAEGFIVLAVILALICVCVFFIMRSSLMSRVKEIGIYRAIGVSKKNLTFRFMIESLVITTLSLLPGFIVSTALVMKLSTLNIMADALYMPLWIALCLLVFLYCATVLFGTMPVRALMGRTPSEILAKYDI